MELSHSDVQFLKIYLAVLRKFDEVIKGCVVFLTMSSIPNTSENAKNARS